jgi:hypothetical protein
LSEWTRQGLLAADQERDPLTAADAQRHEAELVVAALHLAQRLGRDRRARGADRVAEGDRAAVGVDALGVEIELPDDRQRLRGERLVDSITPISSIERPERWSTLRTAGTGPMPMTSGSTPQLA